MDTITIDEACDVLNGYAFKSNKYTSSGIRIIRIANVQKGYIEDNSPVFYPINSVGLDKFMLKENDLLLSLTGNVGRTALLTKEMLPAALNQRVACLRLKTNKITNKYLFHLLNSNYFESKCIQSSQGIAQKNMSTEWLKSYELPIYSLSKQNEITTILDNIRNTIDLKEQQLQKYDELIKARFIEMFDDAPVKKIEDVCESFKIGPFGSALHKNEISDNGYSFVLGTDNAVKNEFAYDEIRYINEEKYHQLENYKVNPGEIIMSMMGTVGRVAIIPENIGTAIISSHLCILRVNKNIMLPEFFHLAFCKDNNIQFQIEGIHNGSIMKGFNLKIVKAFEIKCPNIKEQKEFVKFAKQVDKSKLVVQKSLEKTQQLFDSLMQEYFG